ncbi:MAG: 3,4-dihydroxy-2-butanone-4-phosphate synthase [Bacteriovorax sp. MedPE-SWde]|nr:MAG: 3,4-dihydroxy-2-butanone-4-phosphate synthase [Bacteriovorax sp. MedPE-SWde]
MNNFNTIEEALEDIRLGKMVIVIDDEDRENEGDFVMAADRVTPEAINFMASVGKGLICTPITKQRAEELDLPLMISKDKADHDTAFTVSIDTRKGTTGISCWDRALTIMDLAQATTVPNDLMRPGHIFPLIAQDGGVLVRNGHTEAAIDLARLAGCHPSGVICEIMDDDGSMATTPKLFEVAKEHDLKFITIEALVEYRKKAQDLIKEEDNTEIIIEENGVLNA